MVKTVAQAYAEGFQSALDTPLDVDSESATARYRHAAGLKNVAVEAVKSAKLAPRSYGLYTAQIEQVTNYMKALDSAENKIIEINESHDSLISTYIGTVHLINEDLGVVGKAWDEHGGSWEFEASISGPEQRLSQVPYDSPGEPVGKLTQKDEGTIAAYIATLNDAEVKNDLIRKEMSTPVYLSAVYLVNSAGSFFGVFANDTPDGNWEFHPATTGGLEIYKRLNP